MMRAASLFHRVLCSVLLLSLVACSGDTEEVTEEEGYANASAEELYTRARERFAEKDYETAVELFDEVERQHPYSEWAARAQILAGFTQYSEQNYDDATLTFERFIKLHPGSDSAPYALYMMALCQYEQISDVGRDQGVTRKAREALREVVKRYPDSEYARDAKLKLDLTEDHLAGKEMTVGRYYLERGELLSAVNRFRRVVEEHQTTSHVPEALHRLVETYLALGVRAEAERYAAVLGHNFPGNTWYQYSYNLLKKGASIPKEKEKEGGVLSVF
jgi:outer membrane protein assembly factor BamD